MQKQLIDTIHTIANDRHKMVIVLGDFGSGKTALLKDVASELPDGEYVNLNLQLTERLLSLPQRRYNDGVTVHRIIDELCDELSPDGRPLFVDNIEILFSPELGKLNPVDTFKRMSRQRPIVLSLPARRAGNAAEYSQVGRDDHMRILIEEFTVVEMEKD